MSEIYLCEFCDTEQPQERKFVTVTRQRNNTWFVFERVEAWVCPNCGHRYFDADTALAMEEQMNEIPPDAQIIEAYSITMNKPQEGSTV